MIYFPSSKFQISRSSPLAFEQIEESSVSDHEECYKQHFNKADILGVQFKSVDSIASTFSLIPASIGATGSDVVNQSIMTEKSGILRGVDCDWTYLNKTGVESTFEILSNGYLGLSIKDNAWVRPFAPISPNASIEVRIFDTDTLTTLYSDTFELDNPTDGEFENLLLCHISNLGTESRNISIIVSEASSGVIIEVTEEKIYEEYVYLARTSITYTYNPTFVNDSTRVFDGQPFYNKFYQFGIYKLIIRNSNHAKISEQTFKAFKMDGSDYKGYFTYTRLKDLDDGCYYVVICNEDETIHYAESRLFLIEEESINTKLIGYSNSVNGNGAYFNENVARGILFDGVTDMEVTVTSEGKLQVTIPETLSGSYPLNQGYYGCLIKDNEIIVRTQFADSKSVEIDFPLEEANMGYLYYIAIVFIDEYDQYTFKAQSNDFVINNIWDEIKLKSFYKFWIRLTADFRADEQESNEEIQDYDEDDYSHINTDVRIYHNNTLTIEHCPRWMKKKLYDVLNMKILDIDYNLWTKDGKIKDEDRDKFYEGYYMLKAQLRPLEDEGLQASCYGSVLTSNGLSLTSNGKIITLN